MGIYQGAAPCCCLPICLPANLSTRHPPTHLQVYSATTFKYVFAFQPGDTYWCTADCGWITGA